MEGRKLFKIYMKKTNDTSFSTVIEGQCDKFDDNISKYGSVFTLSSAYKTSSRDLLDPMNSILAIENAIAEKVEIYDAVTETLLYTSNVNTNDINYSVKDPVFQLYGLIEVLRFKM